MLNRNIYDHTKCQASRCRTRFGVDFFVRHREARVGRRQSQRTRKRMRKRLSVYERLESLLAEHSSGKTIRLGENEARCLVDGMECELHIFKHNYFIMFSCCLFMYLLACRCDVSFIHSLLNADG